MDTFRIAVYCSARNGLPELWVESARKVGQWIGRHQATLIYGGVTAGLMTVVATATKEAGGKIVGVVPARLRNKVSPLNDVKVPTGGLDERKKVMDVLADAFVVLPGGYGTLDEFATTFSHLNFTHQLRPIVIANLDGIYDPLLEQLERMKEAHLLDESALEILHVAKSLPELEAILDSINTKE